jgi:hypothetical protein
LEQGPLAKLLNGQVYAAIYNLAYAHIYNDLALQPGGAAAKALAPMLALLRDAGRHHAGEVYCPVIPMM